MGYECMDQTTLAVAVVGLALAAMLLGIGIGHMMAADYLRRIRLAKEDRA